MGFRLRLNKKQPIFIYPKELGVWSQYVRDRLTGHNFAKQLKALKFKTPYEAIQELWKSKPEAFIVKPHHHMLGPNT